MSVKIKLSDLKGHEKRIDSSLTIRDTSFVPGKGNYNKKPPVKMYLCNEGIIHLPFKFA